MISSSIHKNLFNLFPTPEYLSFSSVGIVITDLDTKFVQLRREILGDGFKPLHSREIENPKGAIESGIINNRDELTVILKQLLSYYNVRHVHAILPEEKAYIFTTKIDWVPPKGLRDAVAFILESNAPVSITESVFDFEIISENKSTNEIRLAVCVLPENVVNSYTEAFESAGIVPISFDTESQAIARAVVSCGDKRSHILINIYSEKTGFYVVEDEVVQFSTTLTYSKSEADSYASIDNLKLEMNKVVTFWDSRTENLENKVKKIILCGPGANNKDFVDKLMGESNIPFAIADVWLNMSPSRTNFSEISPAQSILYASVIGVALPHSQKNMFKLLTEKERGKVKREYAMRRAVVMLLGLIFVFLTGLIGLLPSYVLSHARQNEVTERTRIMDNVGYGEDEQNLQAWLLEVKHRLAVLSPKLDVDRPSYFIEKILDQRISGVLITSISLVKTKDGTNLSVNGFALDRQALIAFQNNLNSSGYFSESTLPISDLAKDKDIDFQIKFSPI